MPEIINIKEKREIAVLTPEGCHICGINTKEWIAENPEKVWLKVDLIPGISIYACPKCHVTHFNPNALENHLKMRAWAKEDEGKLIKLASTPADPRHFIQKHLQGLKH